MARVEVNGVHLNVESAGEGSPLVLLHGFTGSTATWASHIDEFARSHRVIAIDSLGHGLSDSPDDPARYGIGFASEDLIAVLDLLGVGKAALLGYSMGGRVALSVAIVAPERLSALVVESASPGLPDGEARRARADSDAQLASEIEQEGVEAFIARWERMPLFSSQSGLSAEARATLRDQRLGNSAKGLAGSLRGLGQGSQPPLHDHLPTVQAPTLFIAGELDPGYCRMGREVCGLIPRSRLAVVPDAGHAVHLEQPESFRDLVLEFLREVNR